MIYTAKEASEIAARFNWQQLFNNTNIPYPYMPIAIMDAVEKAIHNGLRSVNYDYSWISEHNTLPNEYKQALLRLGYLVIDDKKGGLGISWGNPENSDAIASQKTETIKIVEEYTKEIKKANEIFTQLDNKASSEETP